MGYLQLLLFAILIGLAVQDFKYRAVYAWLFLLLFVVLGCLKLLQGTWMAMFTDLAYNTAFLAAQILLLSVYFSIKYRKWTNIFKVHFGLGDLLFLFSIAVYFSFLNYVLFYLLSLTCCVLIGLLINVYVKSFKNSIPLAGMQAVVFALCLGFSLFNTKIVLTSDLGLVKLFGL